MMNIFKSKSSSFLGLDVGTDSIKLVELEGVGGRPRLVTYGMVEVDSTVARNNDTPDNKAEQEKIAGALKSLLEKSGASATDAVAVPVNAADVPKPARADPNIEPLAKRIFL